MATTKQKIAAKKISENIRSTKIKPIGEILKESGYSESVCKSPQRVTKSKGWEKLMEEYFPTEYLYKIHKKLLNKKEIISYRGTIIRTNQPHSDVKYALSMIYKLKGMDKEYEQFDTRDKDIQSLSMKGLDKEIKELEKELRYKYIKEKM